MNPITHLLVGWCAAETSPRLTRRERAAVALAGIAPDLDGFGILPELFTRDSAHPLLWWSEYHHRLAHNLLFALGTAAVVLALTRRTRAALLACFAVHLHLLCDLVGSRGPDGDQWPIPYLAPFSAREWSWSGQWALNAWPNIAITLVLLAVTFALATRRGYSPLEIVSRRADAVFVTTLRARLAPPRGTEEPEEPRNR